VLADVPSTVVTGDITLVDALVSTGLVASKSEARRQLTQRGVYVNNKPQSEDATLSRADALHGRFVLLRRGKRDQALLDFAQ
jgi:tyrosyl-tRNA synthetase